MCRSAWESPPRPTRFLTASRPLGFRSVVMKRIDSRILHLRTATEAMLQGNFHPPLPQKKGPEPDEIDELGEALDRLGRHMESSFEKLNKLSELAEKMNEGLLVDDVLDHVFEAFHTVIPYDRIGCALLEDEGRVVRASWGRTRLGTMHLGVGYAAPMKGSSLEQIIATGRPRIINDLEQYLRDKPTSKPTQRMLKEGIRSSLTCPLIAMSKPIGFLFFSSRHTDTYATAHVEFFMRLAGQLSSIIEKGRLYEQLLAAKAQVERANQELMKLAIVDGLTGVANRRAFDERFSAEFRRACREGTPLSVLIVDIDFFKKLNDAYGHLAGDECLKAVGQALRATAKRGGDFAARYGGEEFTLVLPNTDEAGAKTVGESLRARIEALEVDIGEGFHPAKMTVSVGAATLTTSPTVAKGQPAELLAEADHALYTAKRTGRNRVVHATDAPAASAPPAELPVRAAS